MTLTSGPKGGFPGPDGSPANEDTIRLHGKTKNENEDNPSLYKNSKIDIDKYPPIYSLATWDTQFNNIPK